MKTQRNPFAGVVLAAILALPGYAWAQQDISDSRTVSDNVQIEIEDIIVGKIRVIGVAGNQMTVTGTIGADVDEFVIEGGPDYVEISVDLDDWDDDDEDQGTRRWRGRRNHQDVDVNLEIRVPKGASLEIDGVTASFEVEGVDGSIEIDSVTGNITYSGMATELELTNVTGDISVTAGRVTEADLESVNGSISFTGGIAAGGELNAENVNGSIDLTLPADLSAKVYVETMMGNITNAFGQEPKRESRWMPSQELHFTAGSGAGEIYAETLQGSVTIHKR
jgi:hypothetical protein